MLIYSLRDADISNAPPGHTVIIHYRDVKVSFAFGVTAAIACAFGAIRVTHHHVGRWPMLAVYALLIGLTCFPVFVIAQQFLLVTFVS
jgi:hypothetical protein